MLKIGLPQLHLNYFETHAQTEQENNGMRGGPLKIGLPQLHLNYFEIHAQTEQENIGMRGGPSENCP